MKTMWLLCQENRVAQKGQSLAEYGLLLALIATASLAALFFLGGSIDDSVSKITVDGAAGAGPITGGEAVVPKAGPSSSLKDRYHVLNPVTPDGVSLAGYYVEMPGGNAINLPTSAAASSETLSQNDSDLVQGNAPSP